MKRNEYVNAIDHLKFNRDLLEAVGTESRTKPRFRLVRAAVLAAVLGCFMVISAVGAISSFREQSAKVEVLGTDAQGLTDAEFMNFTVSRTNEGVQKHYMELHHARQYHFRHGMLWNGWDGYLNITQDYQLEPVQMKRLNLTLDKDGRTYFLDLDYRDMGFEIISNHRSVYRKSENGEILLNATDGNSSQWPFYIHVESGTVRDALAEWSEADFEGRVGGASELKGGLLVSTIVSDGQSDARNILYWIAPDAQTAKVIELPGNGLWHVENGTIYYQNDAGQLYEMDEDFCFQLICPYETMDYLQDGLLTVSVRGKLGILDAYTGELLVFDEIDVSKSDTMDYHAIRYGREGTIALAHTEWRHDPERIVLCSLGVLDKQTAQLNLLSIENEYDGYHHNWLDETRLAVIYQSGDRQFLCVYEFEN